MKKTVLLLAVILGTFSITNVSAQKNSAILSGTLSYTKATDVKASYGINPLIGYFVTDKVAVGVLGQFEKTDSENKSTSVGVFTRCHFLKVGKNCQVFSQLSAITNSVTDATVKTKSTDINLGLGANYTITKKLDLTMQVADLASYTNSNSKSTFVLGFSGIENPFAVSKFGVIYKF